MPALTNSKTLTIEFKDKKPTCLSNSRGGWAPYFSLAGMFKSSTNTTHFLPGGGPYTPFRRLKKILTIKYRDGVGRATGPIVKPETTDLAGLDPSPFVEL